MPASSVSAYGVFALIASAVLVVALLGGGVKLRSASRRFLGVRVYDFGADLSLPPTIATRSYQIALYLTMKSLPREPAETPAPRVSAPAPAPREAPRAHRAV